MESQQNFPQLEEIIPNAVYAGPLRSPQAKKKSRTTRPLYYVARDFIPTYTQAFELLESVANQVLLNGAEGSTAYPRTVEILRQCPGEVVQAFADRDGRVVGPMFAPLRHHHTYCDVEKNEAEGRYRIVGTQLFPVLRVSKAEMPADAVDFSMEQPESVRRGTLGELLRNPGVHGLQWQVEWMAYLGLDGDRLAQPMKVRGHSMYDTSERLFRNQVDEFFKSTRSDDVAGVPSVGTEGLDLKLSGALREYLIAAQVNKEYLRT